MNSAAAWFRANRVALATFLLIVAAWEVAAHLMPKPILADSPPIPPLEIVFGAGLIGLSDYWKIDMLAPVPELGGARTLLGALLALGYHAVFTIFRFATGLAVGAAVGISLGLLLSGSRVVRRVMSLPLTVLRTFPLLALIPFFQYWFGTSDLGAVVFVAYGVGVFYLVGTLNAVANVPPHYIEYARTLGHGRAATYRHVIVPAIIPELGSVLLLTMGIAWSAVIGAEYVGAESGIGRMIIWAEYFSNTPRMMLVTIVIVALAVTSIAVAKRVLRRITAWAPASANFT